MARKHEKFSLTYGWKTAPESYKFYLNGKIINLDFNKRNQLGYMCVCGKLKDAEDELKRLLRKEEKSSALCGRCVAFYQLGGDRYVHQQDFLYNPNNRSEALAMYKKWKHYIQERDNKLPEPVRITKGYVTPYGMTKGEDVTEEFTVDLSQKCIIKVVRNPKYAMFPNLLRS